MLGTPSNLYCMLGTATCSVGTAGASYCIYHMLCGYCQCFILYAGYYHTRTLCCSHMPCTGTTILHCVLYIDVCILYIGTCAYEHCHHFTVWRVCCVLPFIACCVLACFLHCFLLYAVCCHQKNCCMLLPLLYTLWLWALLL